MNDVIPKTNFKYIFLGHTYEWSQPNTLPQVDPRIEQLDLDIYDGIWLGGDNVHTLSEQHTIDYLDGLFDLKSNSTHWSLGNHEIRDGGMPFVELATQKESFYCTTLHDMVILVLNTPMLDAGYDLDCSRNERQMSLINNVLDTISVSKHLVILSHFALWGSIEPEANTIDQFANSDQRWKDFICDERSRFQDIVYPKLIDVHNLGINVLMISGDGGQKHKGYEYTSQAGIKFLVSGINNSVSEEYAIAQGFNYQEADSVLIFQHDIISGSLEYDFVELNSL